MGAPPAPQNQFAATGLEWKHDFTVLTRRNSPVCAQAVDRSASIHSKQTTYACRAYQAEQPRLRPAAAQRAAEPVVADVDDAQAGELPGRRVRQRATARRVGEESARAVSSARYLPMRSSEPICHQQQPLPCKAMVNLHASYSAHLKSLLSSSRKVRLG